MGLQHSPDSRCTKLGQSSAFFKDPGCAARAFLRSRTDRALARRRSAIRAWIGKKLQPGSENSSIQWQDGYRRQHVRRPLFDPTQGEAGPRRSRLENGRATVIRHKDGDLAEFNYVTFGDEPVFHRDGARAAEDGARRRPEDEYRRAQERGLSKTLHDGTFDVVGNVVDGADRPVRVCVPACQILLYGLGEQLWRASVRSTSMISLRRRRERSKI